MNRPATPTATAAQWRNRGLMQAKADHHQQAYDDFLRALDVDPNDAAALDGVVTSSAILDKSGDALARLSATKTATPGAGRLVATSKLLAASGRRDEAIAAARDAVALNAAAALVVSDRAGDLTEGAALAAAAIDDGRAAQALERLARITSTPLETDEDA